MLTNFRPYGDLTGTQKTDDEIELVLDRTITLFRFITEKDAFERYYKGHLARRLLSGRSVSDDAERGMLAKLKVECGFQFTKKMEGMFQDMKISADTTSEYKNYIQSTGVGSSPIPFLCYIDTHLLQASIAELNVTVMTSTFWPMSQASPTCVIPPELLQAYNSFEHYYNSRHSGRRLTWQPSLGNADLIARFKTREHTLNVSTYAAIILLLFQDLPPDDFLMYEVRLLYIGPYIVRTTYPSSVGHQKCNRDSGGRSPAKPTVTRVCEI